MPTDLHVLGRAIKQAQWRHHRTLDALLIAQGTTLVQWDALRAIQDRPGASAHELAAATFQSDQSFGTLAQRLVARGLVERTPGAGRRIEHHVTDAGRAVIVTGLRISSEVLADSFAPLGEDDRARLLDLLRRLHG